MTRRILALLLIVLPLAIACRTVTYNQAQHTEYWYTTSGTGAALDAGPHRMGTTSTIVGPVLPVNIEDDAGDILGASVSHPIVTTGGGGYVTIDGGTVTVSPNPLPVTFDAGNAATSIVGTVPISYAALTQLNTTGAVPKTGLVLCDAGASCTICQLITGNESNIGANCGLFPVQAIPTSWTSTAPTLVFPIAPGGNGAPPQAYSEIDWGNGCIRSATGWTVACSTAGPGDGGAGQVAWSAVAANYDFSGWGCTGTGCVP